MKNETELTDKTASIGKVMLAAVFMTKKQVVKVNDKYAARYRKWYQFSWRYLGQAAIWDKTELHQDFILTDTKEAACSKLKRFFPTIEVLNCC